MKLKTKVLSAVIAGVMTVMSFCGVMPKIFPNTGSEMMVSAADTFVPRKTEPLRTDPNYTTNNPYYPTYGMPNCTCYAYGRAMELLGYRPNLSRGNAYEWYGYNQSTKAFPSGNEPKLGAIACWSGGHVAVVEGIDADTIWLSESDYPNDEIPEGIYFRYYSINRYNMGNDLQGYIYIGDWTDKRWYDDYAKMDLGKEFYAEIKCTALDLCLSYKGTNALALKSDGTQQQLWRFVRQSDGGYSIINKKSGLSLDVENFGTESGTNIHMVTYSGNTAQHFYIYNTPKGYIFRPACNDLVFDLQSYDSYNLGVFPLDDYLDNKAFSIVKWYKDQPLADLGTNFDARIENTYSKYFITADNSNVIGKKAVNNDTQLWHFYRNNDGSYAITSKVDKKSMDIDNYGTANGTNVKLMGYGGNNAQKYYIYKVGDAYLIRTACSDLVFDLEGYDSKADKLKTSYNLATYPLDDYYDNKVFVIHKESNTIQGDVNNDSKFNATDAVQLKKFLLGITTLKAPENADLNGDGKVNVFDFIMMKRLLISK